MDSQEVFDTGRPSLCDDIEDSNSDDDDESFFYGAAENMEDVILPTDMLHNPEGLARPLPQHRRRMQSSCSIDYEQRKNNVGMALAGSEEVGSPTGTAAPLKALASPKGAGLHRAPGGSLGAAGLEKAPTGFLVRAGVQRALTKLATGGWPNSSQTFGEGWLGGFHPVEE